MGKASNLVPLLVLVVLIAIAAFIGFIAYSVANDVSDKAAKRMEKKNIKFSKEGMSVGVKQLSTEDISDSTQSALMKVWNSASLPVYKAKLRWGQSAEESRPLSSDVSSMPSGRRKPYSRSDSNQRDTKKS
ncbi:hypothetical protein EPUS_07026 [Endocarpon pusillum Z07020]|uniref:Uncharacterized protein n=1 Tax=Endocarpon pusillum (strain Z07020 / HMAS-L-300199) TaxID=1263415 RepID=U1HHX4_ENDPU|nr:uncharacterized protein EPUS_07026 [Endocarpon pusillum Z07020]ERF69770.1 hypothetical protein EPUS_07026 [Endocarpon pusillum Z07020]